MSGRPASLLVALWLPAILSATCNPKKTQPEGARAAPDAEGPAAEQPVETAPEGVQACPGLVAAAGPLGPAVAPACPGKAAAPDAGLAQSLEALAAVHAKGLEPMGKASAVSVQDAPAVLRSAVLQGPPHCYVVVVRCEQDGAVQLRIAAAGASEPLVVAEGPAARICPAGTGSFDFSVTAEKPPLACAARLYGD
ncbi:MAG: hypothetical protein JRG91_05530 [Deltaproteobacteria bacterium]|nr:hypothetical protein [Deltaproteobacteria bacterium]